MSDESPRVVRVISHIGAREQYGVVVGSRILHYASTWTMCEQWIKEQTHVDIPDSEGVTDAAGPGGVTG